MEKKPLKAEEKKSAEKLKDFLRETGRMIPQTPAQVEAFESRHRKKAKLPELLADPIAMLRRGFILEHSDNYENEIENTNGQSMAARKMLNLSADTLRKMDEDRKNAENQK